MWVQHGAEYLLNLYSVDSATGEERFVGLFGQSAAMVNDQMEEIDFAYFGPPEVSFVLLHQIAIKPFIQNMDRKHKRNTNSGPLIT